MSPAFADAYDALAAEFAARGELERREVIARWVDRPASEGARFHRRYHLLIARDDHGALVGVRDGHVVIDRDARIAVMYLAHALVLPPFRRTGLGALLRRAPLDLARAEIAAVGLGSADVLLAAEMEPVVLADEASIVRLLAYGRDGFAAIDPVALPYFQPDFSGAAVAPLPLLAVVRHLGHEAASSIPKRLARAVVDHLYAVFATHLDRAHLADLRARTFAALDAHAHGAVPLLPLPRTLEDRSAIEPLVRDALPHVSSNGDSG
jgi:GNAT superfamily N-acetyltransferase